MQSRQFATSLLLVAALTVVGGLVALGRSGRAIAIPEVNDAVDMPPFRMLRELRYSDGSDVVFELVWRGQDSWRETVISSEEPKPGYLSSESGAFDRTGSYQEVTGGEYVRFDLGRRVEQDAGPNIQIPGEWFADLDRLLGRWKQAVVMDNGTAVTITVTTKVNTSEWVLDKKTGIPLEYRALIDGKLASETRATSVVLLSGEVVR